MEEQQTQTIGTEATRYLAAGLRVVPASRTKKIPVLPGGSPAPWKGVTPEGAADRWTVEPSGAQDAMSVVCGSASGSVEIIDFDHKGKQFPAWRVQVPDDLFDRLVAERTPSGGVHVGYRCETIEGNVRLSNPPKPKDKAAKWTAYIETRGEGGVCLIAPSPGYELLGSRTWCEITNITPEERDVLLTAARSLSEHHPVPKQPSNLNAKEAKPEVANSSRAIQGRGDERPGDRYNREATEETTVGILETAGWTVCGTAPGCTRLTRPGKGDGVSGSVHSSGVFYCFTSSAPQFSPSEAYSPFGVYAIVRHAGDFAAAAKALASQYGPTPRTAASPADAVWDNSPLDTSNAPDCLPTTDLGNARRLVHYHGQDLRHVPGVGWYYWADTHWRQDQTGESMRRAKATVERIHHEVEPCRRRERHKECLRWAIASESGAKLSSLLDVASTEAAVVATADQLDADRWKLAVANGTLDLRTGELLPHDRADLITRVSPVAFDGSATCPVFDAFLSRIFSGNADLVRYVLAVLGHALTGDVSLEHLWVFYGSGANGKSTLLGIVQHVMGDLYNIAPDSLLADSGRAEHPTELTELQGRRLVVGSETESGAKLRLQLVKRLTGEPTITARRMYGNYYTYPRTHKLVLMTNNKPRIKEDGEAVWRRVKLVPFNATIPAEERDPQLGAKLRAEASGILNRLLGGCLDWQANGLVEPAEVRDATKEYRDESDPLAEFLCDVCMVAPNAWCLSSNLYAAYVEHCKRSGDNAISGKAFGGMLVKRGFTPARRKIGRGWAGVSIVQQENDVNEWQV